MYARKSHFESCTELSAKGFLALSYQYPAFISGANVPTARWNLLQNMKSADVVRKSTGAWKGWRSLIGKVTVSLHIQASATCV